MIAYKIVTVDSSHMYSLNTFGEWCLEYELGKKTYPKIGKIFVYENIPKPFEGDGTLLLECEIPDNSYRPKYRCNSGFQELYEKFWNDDSVYHIHYSIDNSSDGVLYADWCFPIRALS